MTRAVRDEWIYGVADDDQYKYIIHAIYPRFIARIERRPSNGTSGTESELELTQIQWIDPEVEGSKCLDLIRQAVEALRVLERGEDKGGASAHESNP
jgi:hypothetical protein